MPMPKYEEPQIRKSKGDKRRESWSKHDPIGGTFLRKSSTRAKSAAEQQHNLALAGSLGDDGGDWADIMRRLPAGHAGEAKNFGENLRQMAPLIMAQLLKTDAAKDIMDFGRMTDIAYQPAVQQMERGTLGAIESTRGAMALSGMGQGTAMPAMEGQMRMAAAGNRGNMYQSMLLQNLQSRYNIQQNVAAMGMGMAPAPMQGGGGGGTDWGPIAAAAGSALGSYFGGGGGGGRQPGPAGYGGDPRAGQWTGY